MAKVGIHATRIQRRDQILKAGLHTMPFWRSRRALRRPKEFKLRYPSHANVLTGKTLEETFHAVYDALRAANTPFVGTSRKRFNLKKTHIFLVDLNKSIVIAKNERNFVAEQTKKEEKKRIKEGLPKTRLIEELVLKSAPTDALKSFALSEEEINRLEKETEGMNWLEANRQIAKYVATKIIDSLD